MDWDSRPTPHPQTAARIVDGSAVIVLADTGAVNVLNSVGTRVWELCDGSHSARQIAEIIAAEFEVTQAEAAQDVEGFLQQLARAQMVVL